MKSSVANQELKASAGGADLDLRIRRSAGFG